MKKILVLIALVTTMSMGFFSSPFSAPSTGSLQQADHDYELDTWGENSEIYEFTPRSNPNMTCVVFMNDSITTLSMECFLKPLKQTK